MSSDYNHSRPISRRGSFMSERSIGGGGDRDSVYSNFQLPDDPPDPSQRTWRNIIGYHNAVRDITSDLDYPEFPPSYEETTAKRLPGNSSRLRSRSEPPPPSIAGNEVLPDYYCSVLGEGVVDMKMEFKTPFLDKPEPYSEWKSVYIVLRGTLFSIHQVKHPGLFSKDNGENGETAGRLIRKYNLQHAEVGSAADHKKVEWVPRPGVDMAMVDGHMQDDASLFQPVRQYVLRLRLEGHQFILRFKSSFLREEWLKIICGAIDIASDLDERTEPRHLTLPRRHRNRRQSSMRSQDAQASSLMEEQERIIRQNFPHLANEGNRMTSLPDPDREDLDRGIFSRDAGSTISTSQQQSVPQNLVPRPVDPNFQVAPGKWSPRLYIDPVAEVRARKQCMPVLLSNSRRHGPLIVQDNKRFKLDWDSYELIPYPEEPPPYDRRRGSGVDTKDYSKPLFRIRSASGSTKAQSKRSSSVEAAKRRSAPPTSMQPRPASSVYPSRPSSIVSQSSTDSLPQLVPSITADTDVTVPPSPMTPTVNRPSSVRLSRSPSNVVLPSIREGQAQDSSSTSTVTAQSGPTASDSAETPIATARGGQARQRPYSVAGVRRPDSASKSTQPSAEQGTGLGISRGSNDSSPLRSNPTTKAARPKSTAVDSRPAPSKAKPQQPRQSTQSPPPTTKSSKQGVWRNIMRAFSGNGNTQGTGKKSTSVVEKSHISNPIEKLHPVSAETRQDTTAQDHESAARAQLFSERMYTYATHRKSRPISGVSTTSAPETIYENENDDEGNSGDESVAGTNTSEERTSLDRQKMVGTLRNQVNGLFWV